MDSYKTKSTLNHNGHTYVFYNIQKLKKSGHDIKRLPWSLQIILENLLRNEDGRVFFKKDIEAILNFDNSKPSQSEIAFMPARVLLQDFTGVPAVVDLASMRDAMVTLGAKPDKINPLLPVELVIDHSISVDHFGSDQAQKLNTQLEYERNKERYAFLKWGQNAFRNFSVVPPSTGIVHQVNLEHLAKVVFNNNNTLYPDTVIGTDSHTTMINGLGVLGWGVGGIEAEAAMLGQATSMLIPNVVGFKMTGQMPYNANATDLVLTVTQMLRKKGVVGKFVEFFGQGLLTLSLADRATVANMAPEYGATCGLFPVDDKTLEYLKLTGRAKEHIDLIRAYFSEQGWYGGVNVDESYYQDVLHLDLSSVEPCVAGPKRPQDRLPLKNVQSNFKEFSQQSYSNQIRTNIQSKDVTLKSGHVVLAAITSCTNTSNPFVMIQAGLLAKKALALGLKTKPWVKTSLAPGSKVVKDYLNHCGLLSCLEQLKFNIVGFGCTTCIGNSGPLPLEVSKAIDEGQLTVAAVLSGNRNFEGRVNPQTKANYLASPALVLAYALAGTVDIDFETQAISSDTQGKPVFLKDIWPNHDEVTAVLSRSINKTMFENSYQDVFKGDLAWQTIQAPTSSLYQWDSASTYIKKAPYFENMTLSLKALDDINNARVLALLGDSITTDHISPAGNIATSSPAGDYLKSFGLDKKDFNAFGARRGHHEVMVRGTFGNIRLKNLLLDQVEGPMTKHFPSSTVMSIFDASTLYQKEKTPLIIIAGQEYGTGSSRDWAAKGPNLLGIKAVIAQSFERIHRSNLVGMGIIPFEFMPNQNAKTLGLKGDEFYTFGGLGKLLSEFKQKTFEVQASRDGISKSFEVKLRVDTPQEALYILHGGILRYVLRQLIEHKKEA